MGAVEDARYELSRMRRLKTESDEEFAARLYEMQMEVYSANAGSDLSTPFWSLPEETRRDWIRTAKNHK